MPASSDREIVPATQKAHGAPAAPALEPAIAAGPSRPGGRPAWQRHPLFKFFSSVKLAVVLLSVLIVASIAGTLYEATFDARVARAYIYNAWWFNLWLTLLCTNLACAAFSRMPWKRHHTGFLVTHLGIIILLIGAMIGRGWGIEGTMTLHKDEPPNNQLIAADQRVLRVEQPGFESRQYPVEIIGRHPTPARPWSLGKSAGGWDITLFDYAPLIDANFEPQPAPAALAAGAQPAVRIKLVTKRVGATLDQWLLAGDPEHGTLDLSGLASVQVRRGVAPEPGGDGAGVVTTGPTVDESFVVFALRPDAPIGQTVQGTTPSGAKARLAVDAATGKKTVLVDWRGAAWHFDPEADGGKDQDLSGSGLNVLIDRYWPDFVMKDGQPASASDAPNNPAALVRIHGHLPAPSADDNDASLLPAAPTPVRPGMPPPMGAGTQAGNQAVIYCDDQGGLTYTLKSRATPTPMRGVLKVGDPIPTGWMDWQMEAVQAIPAAIPRTVFRPAPDAPPASHETSAASGGSRGVDAGDGPIGSSAGNRGEGVRVRLTRGSERYEQWAAVGWQITLPTTPEPTRLAYDSLIEGLPIGLQLEKFEVEFNDGTDSPSSFQSHLKVTDLEGKQGRGSCSMNEPFNFPGHWWNTFSGLTYKMSQAQWNPADTNESTVQILRDPGWLFKWIGSLLICTGIFTMFYLRPAPKVAAGL